MEDSSFFPTFFSFLYAKNHKHKNYVLQENEMKSIYDDVNVCRKWESWCCVAGVWRGPKGKFYLIYDFTFSFFLVDFYDRNLICMGSCTAGSLCGKGWKKYCSNNKGAMMKITKLFLSFPPSSALHSIFALISIQIFYFIIIPSALALASLPILFTINLLLNIMFCMLLFCLILLLPLLRLLLLPLLYISVHKHDVI